MKTVTGDVTPTWEEHHGDWAVGYTEDMACCGFVRLDPDGFFPRSSGWHRNGDYAVDPPTYRTLSEAANAVLAGD